MEPVVHCIFSDDEISLHQLLEESFRLFLARMLSMTDNPLEMTVNQLH